MKKMNRFLAVCLLAGLLLMLAVPVFAAEEADYGTVFARASTNSIYDLLEAFFSAPVEFMEALAYQDKDTQQSVIKTLADASTEEQIRAIWCALGLIGTEEDLPQSEKNTHNALRYGIGYRVYSLPSAYKSGDALDALLKESMTGHAARLEGISSELGEAIKGDAVGFVRALTAQKEEIQARVLGLMPYHCYWTMGNVLIDILNGIDKETLTAEEAAVVDALLEKLKDTPEPVKAVDPDPQELAAYLAKKAPQAQVTEPTLPKETVPAPTQPVPTEPVQEPEVATGISGWWLLLVPVGIGAGYLLGKGRKKESWYDSMKRGS